MLMERENYGESMEAATKGVQSENMTIREASKLYNVPLETARSRAC